MIKIKKVTTMHILKFFALFLLLLIQGCTLKEDVTYTKQAQTPTQVPTPVVAPTVKAVVPASVVVKTTQAVAPTPVVVAPSSASEVKVMKFHTINNKTIMITGDNNIIKINNPEYQGKEVVLYLFGRDCHYCTKEISQIRALAKKPNIKVIGIHAHKMIGDAALKAYAKKVGYNFDILSFKNDIMMIRYLKKVGIWHGGTPTHLLIDKMGNVQDVSLTEILNR